MNRRTVIAWAVGAGAIIPASTMIGGAPAGSSPLARNVMDDIPAFLHAGIRRGSSLRDVAPFVDIAARRAVAAGQALYFPAGTYAMVTWAPPAGLTVQTDGTLTVFRQLSTHGQARRFIEVMTNGVRLWPGGSATIDGGMTPDGDNATSFNSAIRVHAGAGINISRFECGDVHGRNIGGDVLETGCLAGGYLGNCVIGALHGTNIYRNILSITGGAQGSVAAILQDGGCGLAVLVIEPDPGSAAVGNWTIGPVVGHRVTIAGDQAAGVGSVEIESLDLDNRRRESIPRFDYGGVARRSSPTMFETGIRYRNIGSLVIGRAAIVDFRRAAIEDIGSQAGDTPSSLVRIGQLIVERCGVDSGYEIVTQKTRRFAIARIESTAKPRPAIGTFLCGFSMVHIELGEGAILGQVVSSSMGDFSADGLTIDGASETLFRDVRGHIILTGTNVERGGVVFERCTGLIDVSESTIETKTLAQLSTRPNLRNTLLNRTSKH